MRLDLFGGFPAAATMDGSCWTDDADLGIPLQQFDCDPADGYGVVTESHQGDDFAMALRSPGDTTEPGGTGDHAQDRGSLR